MHINCVLARIRTCMPAYTMSMISLEALAGGFVMISMVIVWVMWALNGMHGRLNAFTAHVNGELDAMRMTMAAFERV